MAESKGLSREKETVRPRSRRRQHDDDGYERDEREGREGREGRETRSEGRARRRGKTTVMTELQDLNRGGMYVAAETVAIGFDVASKVLRGVVDRAFDEDYAAPGDVLRGLTREADLAVYDLVDELRKVPRRLDRRFEEGIKSPRADRGERNRRQED